MQIDHVIIYEVVNKTKIEIFSFSEGSMPNFKLNKEFM